MCNNYLPIEKGRWLGIARNDRKCTLCNLNEIGDEFHYIMKCKYFNNLSNNLIPSINNRNQNTIHFCRLMGTENTDMYMY